MIIIGFGNKARHGKDTAVQYLLESGLPYTRKRYAFGDLLKAEVYQLLQHPLADYWKYHSDYLTLPHPREDYSSIEQAVAWINDHRAEVGKHLQTYGTEYVRSRDPFYWIKAMHRQLEADKDRVQIALIADLRFPDEALYIKSRKGYTCRVVRLGYQANDGRDPSHISETALDRWTWDYVIECQDGDLDELRKCALQVYEMVLAAVAPEVPEEGAFEVGRRSRILAA